jgi:dihydroorotate dehydrogenase
MLVSFMTQEFSLPNIERHVKFELMKPWLFLPPKLAHDLSPVGLKLIAAFCEPHPYEWQPLKRFGLEFQNRVGIAGGVDKDGACIEDWWRLGAGFIEIGTVTPLPQRANKGKIIDRDIENGALWNRMGFPGRGVWHVRENLRDLPPKRVTPIFVNIGKNRATPNEQAAADYIHCIETIGSLADAYVINISSPNTTGLRDLFKAHIFAPFLSSVLQARNENAPGTPVLLKLSPDLNDEDLKLVIETSSRLKVEGFIATNTTLSRAPDSRFPAEGGVSGRPLADRSKYILRRVIELLGKNRSETLVISVGGIMTPEDVKERLALGADLVQIYTALVLEGPLFFRRVAKCLQLQHA